MMVGHDFVQSFIKTMYLCLAEDNKMGKGSSIFICHHSMIPCFGEGLILYIANRSRWNFAGVKLNCNLLENIRGWRVVVHGQSLLHRLPYSRKILRAPIFEDFEVFSSTSKILSSNFVKSQELI